MTVQAVPDGYHTVTPYLIINGAAQAIEFYKSAFAATEVVRMPDPKGRIGHAEIKIGDRSSCWRTSTPRWDTAVRARSAARA
jgi:PhnB protein